MKKHISFPIGLNETDISEYGICTYDSYCGEPTGWGYKILKHLGPDIFNALSEQGEMVCIYPEWFLVTKRLTKEEAIAKYGEITDTKIGPRGGFKSETYGTTTFKRKLQ